MQPKDALAIVRLRSAALAAIRAFFAARGVIEVDTPQLVTRPGLEPHLDPIAADAGDGEARWLITSPEHRMKRLVAAGAHHIFQLGHVFRAGEVTPRHRPEFTLLEWYRAGASLADMLTETEALVRHVADALGSDSTAALRTQRFVRTSCADAIAQHTGIVLDPSAPDAFVAAVRAQAGVVRPGFDFEDAFFWAMGERVEPALAAQGRPTFITRWPAQMAALAQRCTDDPRFCERAELYGGGLEICNAYFELTDAEEQRARFVADNAKRRALNKQALPVDEELLAALPHMPPTAGNALGVDRLLMWLTADPAIARVQL